MSNERIPRQKSASSQSHSERAIARNRVAAHTITIHQNTRRWRCVNAGSGWVRSIAGGESRGSVVSRRNSYHETARLRDPAPRSVELPIPLRQFPQRSCGQKSLAMFLREVVETRQDVWQAEFVCVAQQASAEGREAGAH